MSKTYLVLHISEDGDVDLERLSGETITRRLNEKHYDPDDIITYLPNNINNVAGVMIIEGDIVVPMSIQTIVKWRLP